VSLSERGSGAAPPTGLQIPGSAGHVTTDVGMRIGTARARPQEPVDDTGSILVSRLTYNDLTVSPARDFRALRFNHRLVPQGISWRRPVE